jgi:hypothetical protein
MSACGECGPGDGERNVFPFLPPPSFLDCVGAFEDSGGGDEDWRNAVTWEAFFEPLIVPSLDDFFGFISGVGESEADSEVVVELRRLRTGWRETGGFLERLVPPRLPTLTGLVLPTCEESSEEDDCSRSGRGRLCNMLVGFTLPFHAFSVFVASCRFSVSVIISSAGRGTYLESLSTFLGGEPRSTSTTIRIHGCTGSCVVTFGYIRRIFVFSKHRFAFPRTHPVITIACSLAEGFPSGIPTVSIEWALKPELGRTRLSECFGQASCCR